MFFETSIAQSIQLHRLVPVLRPAAPRSDRHQSTRFGSLTQSDQLHETLPYASAGLHLAIAYWPGTKPDLFAKPWPKLGFPYRDCLCKVRSTPDSRMGPETYMLESRVANGKRLLLDHLSPMAVLGSSIVFLGQRLRSASMPPHLQHSRLLTTTQASTRRRHALTRARLSKSRDALSFPRARWRIGFGVGTTRSFRQ